MSEGEESILRAALPPATDYLTYLTILEYNLEESDLPELHEILQDEKLVTNIGWDLVHILVPLHPHSTECLEDIAVRGNPREVIIKVTEELKRIEDETLILLTEISDGIPDGEGEEDDDDQDGDSKAVAHRKALVNRNIDTFITMLRVLCILHPRIKTKKPSRFLESSLEAILSIYSLFAAWPNATRGVLMFLRAMSGSKRPTLPPRSGEHPIPTMDQHEVVTDPEADPVPIDDDEEAATRQILQSGIAIAMELHLVSQAESSQSLLAWTDRYVYKTYPDRVLSERKSLIEAFEESEELVDKELLVNQILNVAMSDLGLDWSTMISIARRPREKLEARERAPVLISGTACLMAVYLNRRTANAAETDQRPTFFDHQNLLLAILGDSKVKDRILPPGTIIDAVLRVGWAAILNFQFLEDIQADDAFERYLLALCPWSTAPDSDALSFNVGLFSRAVFRSHPSSQARHHLVTSLLHADQKGSIRALALSWVQDEYNGVAKGGVDHERASGNVFAEPKTLKNLVALALAGDDLRVEEVDMDMKFHNAALNLLYFWCISKTLRSSLRVSEAVLDTKVGTRYLDPLESALVRAKKDLGTGTPPGRLSGIQVLDFNLQKARDGLNLLSS